MAIDELVKNLTEGNHPSIGVVNSILGFVPDKAPKITANSEGLSWPKEAKDVVRTIMASYDSVHDLIFLNMEAINVRNEGDSSLDPENQLVREFSKAYAHQIHNLLHKGKLNEEKTRRVILRYQHAGTLGPEAHAKALLPYGFVEGVGYALSLITAKILNHEDPYLKDYHRLIAQLGSIVDALIPSPATQNPQKDMRIMVVISQYLGMKIGFGLSTSEDEVRRLVRMKLEQAEKAVAKYLPKQ